MKDSELRGLVLQFLYERRDEDVTFGADGSNIPGIPDATARDWLRVCRQLGEKDLIDWDQTTFHVNGGEQVLEGTARINADGVDVVEGEAEPPFAIKIDHSQTINVTGSMGVQIAGANSNQKQTVTHSFEEIIAAFEEAPVPEEEKQAARSLLLKILDSKVAATVLGVGATYLADKLKGEK